MAHSDNRPSSGGCRLTGRKNPTMNWLQLSMTPQALFASFSFLFSWIFGFVQKVHFTLLSLIWKKDFSPGVCVADPLTPFSLLSPTTHYSAQCVLCKVRCHCIFYGPGIRYSGIFCVPCISSGYSDIFWHISVVDTVAYFGGNHGSRVWKSLKLKKVYFPHTRTSWDKYMFNRKVFSKF